MGPIRADAPAGVRLEQRSDANPTVAELVTEPSNGRRGKSVCGGPRPRRRLDSAVRGVSVLDTATMRVPPWPLVSGALRLYEGSGVANSL
jgi:hypothetical protein